MSCTRTVLDALIAAIREEGPAVLASTDDAEYFRKTFRKKEPIKAVEVQVVVPKPVPAPPLPAPPTAPKVVLPTPPPIPEPLVKPAVNFTSLRNILSIVVPELAILDEIPNDEIAKKLSSRWKTKNQSAPISILVYQEPPEQRAFLEQIARALDIYFGPAKIVLAEEIEKEKQWQAFLSVEGLKTVIICDYSLWQLGNLMHHYKETPALGARVLGNVPLFLLPDLSLYLKDSLLKRSLWKALCQKCS